MSRSKWEAGVRRIIGGGEMRLWEEDCKMYRGGGNLHDALRVLATGSQEPPGAVLSSHFSISEARFCLRLPDDLSVPDGPISCSMKHYNEEATAGPVLRALGCKSKHGLKRGLEDIAWKWYDSIGKGEVECWQLPPLLTRIGFRSKLLKQREAWEKISTGQPLGRAVMMLDAIEQAFSSPLYNILSTVVLRLSRDRTSGWRNTVIRASTDWSQLWTHIRSAGTIVELDWSKFDRERCADDIRFIIDIFCSCFQIRSDRERRLMGGYRKMMENALVDAVIVMDNGMSFEYDGMIPSGSLWTGMLGTALNILYITAVVRSMGIPDGLFQPYCAGDDNLTVFVGKIGRSVLDDMRNRLNIMFRAGIKPEDFLVHYPPYYVTKEQAVFSPDVDLSRGTSHILSQCRWVPFDGRLIVDHSRGMSHRWNYVFRNRPKFLACYFLPSGQPIRPAHDNLEKLLFPEGLHDTIEKYESAILSMIVDNPWNQHNVNHLMQRWN